jgi:Domain of unknown function (DUF4440)
MIGQRARRWFLGALGPLALSLAATAGSAQDTDAHLLQLSADIFRAQIVRGDTTLFSQVALDEFRVLAPGGLFEDKAQVISGVDSWDAVGIEITGEEVVRRGTVALVMGRIDIDGEMRPVGRWGPLKFMTVFIQEGGDWRLLSRSMTPCVDMLIELGRC